MFNNELYAELCKQYDVKEGKLGSGVTVAGEEINKEDIDNLIDAMNPQTTEFYVAVEMYKQFMKDDMLECSKVRKQILKKQRVNYFKQK